MSVASEWSRTAPSDIVLSERTEIVAEESCGESSGLSPKEQEVLVRIVRGDSNQAMADTMGVSVNTIKHHLKNIFRKLRVKRRAQICAAHAPMRLGDQRPNDIRTGVRPSGGVREFVVAGLHAGASNKQMARELMVSTDTIKFHVKNIYRDLDASSRTEAMALLRLRAEPARFGRLQVSHGRTTSLDE